MNILVTGGAGYIGSHTIIELIAAGHSVVIIDNLDNSNEEAVRRVEKLTNTSIPFYIQDVCDKKALADVVNKHKPEAVIHFAGFKSVGESVSHPVKYYRNNIDSTLSLLEVMKDKHITKLIFSSSATVYGEPEKLPLTEECSTGIGITNPYGQTKFMIEQILKDVSASDPDFEITLLRYFNPVGAHNSGLIGEDPKGMPNNLLPYITQVAIGKLELVNVFGDDWNTKDGTGVRDYIHVVDLAKGHTAALKHSRPGLQIFNLATGKGVSVLELIKALGDAANTEIPYTIAPRRPGDVAACYADPQKANRELEWKAEKSIEDACIDSWRWQSQNPNGYLIS